MQVSGVMEYEWKQLNLGSTVFEDVQIDDRWLG